MPPVELPQSDARLLVTRERPDALRISGWLELREPLVLTTPDTCGRYFVLWLRDAWDKVFATIGARTTGTTARAFVLLGPDHHTVPLPPGLTRITAPTRIVEVRGTIEAVTGNAELGEGFAAVPMHRWLGEPAPTASQRGAGWHIEGDDPTEDELSAVCDTDTTGAALDGAARYVLRFVPDGAPPIDGFWTLTTFDREPPVRGLHSLGDLHGLRAAADGSLPILLQHDPPARRQRSNWLPAPEHRFLVELRLYWPRREALDGRWTPPSIVRLGSHDRGDARIGAPTYRARLSPMQEGAR